MQKHRKTRKMGALASLAMLHVTAPGPAQAQTPSAPPPQAAAASHPQSAISADTYVIRVKKDQAYTREDGIHAVLVASKLNKFDPATALIIAGGESEGFQPGKKSGTSTCLGLFQIHPKNTFIYQLAVKGPEILKIFQAGPYPQAMVAQLGDSIDYARKHRDARTGEVRLPPPGDVAGQAAYHTHITDALKNPYINAAFGVALLKKHAAQIERLTGKPATVDTLHMAGFGYTRKFAQAGPDTPISDIMPSAGSEANSGGGRFLTVGDLRDRIAQADIGYEIKARRILQQYGNTRYVAELPAPYQASLPTGKMRPHPTAWPRPQHHIPL